MLIALGESEGNIPINANPRLRFVVYLPLSRTHTPINHPA